MLLTLISPCFPAHSSKICKVNNVEVIHFVVLITKTCFVTLVTAHMWRVSGVSGLCHWGQTETSLVFTHSVLLFCFVQAFHFLEKHCWYMWHFLIFFSVIMTSDSYRKCWGSFRSCYGKGIKRVFRSHRDIGVIDPIPSQVLRGTLNHSFSTGTPHFAHVKLSWCACMYSRSPQFTWRGAAAGVWALMITSPHPHPLFHPS